jgi:hypothetical protein
MPIFRALLLTELARRPEWTPMNSGCWTTTTTHSQVTCSMTFSTAPRITVCQSRRPSLPLLRPVQLPPVLPSRSPSGWSRRRREHVGSSLTLLLLTITSRGSERRWRLCVGLQQTLAPMIGCCQPDTFGSGESGPPSILDLLTSMIDSVCNLLCTCDLQHRLAYAYTRCHV